MHRFRSWTLDPPEWRTQRNRGLPIEGGDGSTLSFDFTSRNDLDSRFVFEASTNGTFINSAGNIEYRQQNLFYTTSWNTTTLPTGWQVGPSPTGSAVWDGQGSVTISTNAGQRWFMIPAAPYILVSSGLSYTISIKVLEKTGDVILGDIITQGGVQGGATPTIGDVVVYINGSSSGVTTNSPVTAGDIVSLSAKIGGTATAWFPRFGLGVNNNMATVKSVKLTQPQANIGIGSQSYTVNTKTSTPYYGPRFDYDPTTLQPRGLLIEPASSNLALSLDPAVSSAYWGRNNITGGGTAGALALNQTGPDNYANSAARITTATTALPINQFVGSATSAAGNTRTFSVWIRGVGSQTTASIAIISNGSPGTPAGINAYIVGPGSITTPVSGTTLFGVVTGLSTTQWTRIGISRTDTIGSFDSFRIYVGDATSASNISSGSSIDIYVPQLESGAGMSSTIPTGASSVTRSYDACYVPTANFTTNSTNWSILAEWEDTRIKDNTTFQKWVCSTSESSSVGTGLFYADSGVNPLGGGVSNFGDAYSVTTVASSSINKAAFSFVRTPTFALRMSFNGEDIVTGTQGQVTIPDKLNIGSRAYSSGGRFLGGYIRKIKYWPSLLSDNELKALSSINYLSPSFDVDFTGMSSLTDLTSRGFTFTRSTHATFINSQGLVEVAAANMILDTGIVTGGTFPWNPFISGTGVNSLSSGVVTSSTGSSGRAFYRASISVSQGLTYSVAIDITNQSGEEKLIHCLLPNNYTYIKYYLNGAPISDPTTASVTTGVLCVVFTASSTTTELRFGVGCNAATADKQVTWTRPRMTLGTNTNPVFISNTSASLGFYNTPRFDYDPTTRQPKGLLIEGSANTLNQYSEDTSNGYWTKFQCTSVSPTTAPDGTNTARLLQEDSGTVGPVLIKNNITVAATTYTLSAFIKGGGRRYCIVRINDFASNADAASLIFDTQTGSVSGAATAYGTVTAASSTIPLTFSESLSGWYRVGLTFTVPATVTQIAVKFCPSATNTRTADGQVVSYTGNGTSGIYVWGIQLETGSGASSYIPTGASTGNRQADILEMTGASFSSIWPLNKRAFSLYCEASLPIVPPPVTTFVWLTRASGGSLHRLTVSTSNLVTYFPGGSIPQLTSAVTPTRDIVFKAATGSVQNDHGFGINNALIVSTDTNTLGTASDSFYFNPNSNQFMHLKNLKLWLYRLPNQTLKTMTA